MVFSEAFIRKPIMTTLVMAASLIFGIAAFLVLPVSDLPVVDYPVITMTVAYPGASPAMVASPSRTIVRSMSAAVGYSSVNVSIWASATAPSAT